MLLICTTVEYISNIGYIFFACSLFMAGALWLYFHFYNNNATRSSNEKSTENPPVVEKKPTWISGARSRFFPRNGDEYGDSVVGEFYVFVLAIVVYILYRIITSLCT
jgi:hypothetical protein